MTDSFPPASSSSIGRRLVSGLRARRNRLGALTLAGLFGAGVLFAATGAAQPGGSSGLVITRDSTSVDRTALEPASFSSVVKRVAPSVVKITTRARARRVIMAPGLGMPGFDDPFFRQFFGNRMPQMREPEQQALGSGVIVSADGYIATNNHVVDGAEHVTVTLADGREFPARVIGRDPQTDVAVIKIEAHKLPAVAFADSGKLEVGDRVLAIGNPFGIGETVTTGIVSAMGRRAGLGLDYEDFIQTDAAINPGNSGGALVDIKGRLVGINTAILSRSGGFQGVGLAVPSDLAGHVVESLVAKGKVVRGYLGVGIQDLTPELADRFSLGDRKGALVSDVRPGGPAAKAGLKTGDIVTSIDGTPVDGSSSLSLAMSEKAPGTSVNLEYVRDGQTLHTSAIAATKPSDGRGGQEQSAAGSQDSGSLNGVTVDDLDEQSRTQIGVPENLRGALITEVAPDSAAARAGLKAGDVILEINRHAVSSAKEAVDLTAQGSTGGKTLLRIWSHGTTVFLVVDESGDAPTRDEAAPDDHDSP